MDNSKLFVTFLQHEDGSSEPVAICSTEELAQERIEANREAQRKLDELWDIHVKPFAVMPFGSCNVPTAECRFRSIDGYYYDTSKAKLFADKREEFGHLPEVEELRKKRTREDYYLAVPVVS